MRKEKSNNFKGIRMSKQEKLLRRLSSKPKDFTWSELVSLMTALGFDMEKSSGSGRKFILQSTSGVLLIHEPHPTKVLKPYQVRDAIALLEKEGFLK
jgi:predicted RNA binding protein YcfA (HicA-like mRNA interferase family)